MQINKIVQIVVLAVLLLLAMVVMSTLLEVRDATRNIILGAGFFVSLLSVLWRKVTIDGTLNFNVIMGYDLGGKGFAYVSPVEPIYIGEICLSL